MPISREQYEKLSIKEKGIQLVMDTGEALDGKALYLLPANVVQLIKDLAQLVAELSLEVEQSKQQRGNENGESIRTDRGNQVPCV